MERYQKLPDDLRQQRMDNFDLGEHFLYPDYAGQSILNIPHTLSQWLGAGKFGAQPIRPALLEGLDERYRQIVFVLVDALGYERFLRWAQEDQFSVWRELIGSGSLRPLTSIAPSTTSAALTTLWTGCPPARHGITGYETWLKEYGIVANMIFHAPFSFGFGELTGSLSYAGFEPRQFLGLPTLGSHLQAAGVQAHAFQNQAILNSGLSEMFFDGVARHGYETEPELWSSVRALLESDAEARRYLWVYWEHVDGYSHHEGPEAEETRQQFVNFSQALEAEFLGKLDTAARTDTLFVLAADHGSVHTPDNPHFHLVNHPNLTRRLHILPTGENRMAYLYVKPGQTEAVREYIERTWPRQFTVVDAVAAVEAGLLGPGERHPGLLDRVGDLIVLAHGQNYLWWADRPNPLIGRHGGLTAGDMLVPFLTVPL